MYITKKSNPSNPLIPWLIQKDEYKPPKCYMDSEREIVEWILNPFPNKDIKNFCTLDDRIDENGKIKWFHSLDTSIMEIADDICYAVHDLEDAITLKLVSLQDFEYIIRKYDANDNIFAVTNNALKQEINSGKNFTPLDKVISNLFSDNSVSRKEAAGNLIHLFISHCSLKNDNKFDHPLLDLNAVIDYPYNQYLDLIIKVFRDLVINKPEVQQMEFNGQRMIIELFNIFTVNPERLLPKSTCERFKKEKSRELKMRVICDYISGMTDDYAVRVYKRLCFPKNGSVFDRI